MRICLSISVILAFTSCCLSDTEVHGKYFGRGVCALHITDEKVVDVNEVHIHNETSWEFCWHFPPWCETVERQYYTIEPTPVKIPHDHIKLLCCPGYRSNNKATLCMPKCSPLCQKGHCIDVGNCTLCASGYDGPKCDKKGGDHEAPNADKLRVKCDCTDDNYVCASNGTCVCAPGFNGTDCRTIIDPTAFLVDRGQQPSCMSYIVRVTVFIALLVLSAVLIFTYIRRRFDIAQFHPLIDASVPSSSQSYHST